MRSIETSFAFPLAAVKPIEQLSAYREFCIRATANASKTAGQQRSVCPGCGKTGQQWHEIEGLPYMRCPACTTLFLRDMPDRSTWNNLLGTVSGERNSPAAAHAKISRSRTENVYLPKLDWIHNTIRLQGLTRPHLVEVATPPSPFTELLRSSGLFVEVATADERDVKDSPKADAAVLLESLDRGYDPGELLQSVVQRLTSGGLIFLTAIVASGFDFVVLGQNNTYLYPPDRANCFSLKGIESLLNRCGIKVIEMSTPGVLDVEIVAAHRKNDIKLPLSPFEEQLLNADEDTLQAFQSFLQQQRMSSFARIVGKKV